MTEYGLYPSYVQVSYHSPKAPHLMTIPTLQWNQGTGNGTFDTHDAVGIDANDMIQALIDEWALLFPDVVEFDFYTIYDFSDPDGLPSPVSYGALTQVGGVAVGTTTWVAIQMTVTWQCLGGSILKLVGMDAVSSANFAKTGPTDILAFAPGLVAEVTGSGNAWASRAGTQPLLGKQIAFTVNEKLRRNYYLN